MGKSRWRKEQVTTGMSHQWQMLYGVLSKFCIKVKLGNKVKYNNEVITNAMYD